MNRLVRLGLALPLSLLLGCSGGERAPETHTVSQPIIGGVTDNNPGSHPAVVMLTNPQGACTGSLIAPKLVLTARHCVSQNITQGIGCDINGASSNGDHVGSDYSPGSFKIYTGVNPNWGSPVAKGAQLFHTSGKNLCNDDIALIVLDQAVAGVTPLPIRLDAPPAIGELVTAVGYGAVNDNQQGAGTRRRRPNVPILSVGQDWNELNGVGEFSTGQAVCSGDSGGPVFSAAGAVMGIASRVSKCSDPNASDKYVRVDYHKPLILQAFAAAGASPIPETGTPPTTPPPKPVGESCKTGAQCTSHLCSSGAGAYCTQFCSGSACPTGTYCTDSTVIISGQSVQEKTCVELPGGSACEQCRAGDCVNVTTTCLNSPECSALLSCADACTDAGCIDGCIAAHPGGADDYDSLSYCACATCPSECANLCTGGGGAGGAPSGGAGGTAGNPNIGGSPSGGVGNAGGAAGATPTSSSGSSGGCSTSPRRAPATPWWALAGLLVAFRRRRKSA